MKKNNFFKFSVSSLCGLLFSLIAIVGIAPEASALSQDIVTKSEMYAVYQCYKEGNMRTPIDSWEYRVGEYTSGGKGPSVLGTTGMTVSLLTTTTGTATYTSCSDLFSKTLQSKVPSKDTSSADLETFMKKIGYSVEKTSDGGVCATYNFAGSSSGSLKLCAPAAGTEAPYTMGSSTLTTSRDGAPVLLKINKYIGHPYVTIRCGGTATSKICGEVYTSSDTSFDDVAQDVFNKIGDYVKDNTPGWYLSGSQASITPGGEKNRFTLDDATSGAVSAVNYFYGKNFTSEAQVKTALSLGLEEQKTAILEALNDYFHIMYFGGSESSAYGNAILHDTYDSQKLNGFDG